MKWWCKLFHDVDIYTVPWDGKQLQSYYCETCQKWLTYGWRNK